MDELKAIARECRREIIKFKTKTGNGHLASSLSLVEILVSLYFDNETWFDHKRDLIVFGKAHGGPAVYPLLARLGYFNFDELEKYCLPEGILRLHPDQSIPGCTYVGGSLGNAVGFAAGKAWANKDQRIVLIMGDAELYEGSVWESLMFIAHQRLENLLIIIDRNKLGILGETEQLLRLEPLNLKFESFGFSVEEVDGHDFLSLRQTLKDVPRSCTVLLAHTIKGKGIDFMEGKAEYHTIIPKDQEQINKILESLN